MYERESERECVREKVLERGRDEHVRIVTRHCRAPCCRRDRVCVYSVLVAWRDLCHAKRFHDACVSMAYAYEHDTCV